VRDVVKEMGRIMSAAGVPELMAADSSNWQVFGTLGALQSTINAGIVFVKVRPILLLPVSSRCRGPAPSHLLSRMAEHRLMMSRSSTTKSLSSCSVFRTPGGVYDQQAHLE
jgi:hypothetical protein